MNLREMRSTVYSLLGDVSENTVKPGEVVQFLNDSQFMMSNLITNMDRERFSTKVSTSAVNGTETYDLPTDFLDVIRVTYAGTECTRIAVSELAALDRNTLHRAKKNQQQYFYIYGGSGHLSQVGIRPIPDDTSAVVVWYYRKPTVFHEEGSYDGTVTGTPTSTTVFNDDAAPFAGSASKTGVDDFWNNAEVYWTKGENTGTRQRVSDFIEGNGGASSDYGEIVLATAAPQTPTAADEFELDQVSIIPPEYHHLLVLYAAHLGAPKAGMDPLDLLGRWKQGMEQVMGKYTNNVSPLLVGQTQVNRTGTAGQ